MSKLLSMVRPPSLLDDRPIVIAGIARLLEELTPAGRVVMRHGGEHPAEKDLLLLGGAVRIDLDIGPPRGHPLDLAHRGNACGGVKVVHDIDRDRRRKAVVRERQLDAIAEMQPPDDLGLAMHQGIFGNVETECFESRTGFHEILDQKALAGPDIEHPIAAFEAEMLDHVLGDREPSPVVTVPAVPSIARPIEILAPILPGDADVLLALRARPLLDVAFGSRIATQQIDFNHPAASRSDSEGSEGVNLPRAEVKRSSPPPPSAPPLGQPPRRSACDRRRRLP